MLIVDVPSVIMLCVTFFNVRLGVNMLSDIYADCHVFNVMLSVVMPSVIM